MEHHTDDLRQRGVPDNEILRRMQQRAEALSINEAARRIGASRATLYRLIGDGKIKARKMGRRTVILADDIDSFLCGLPVISVKSKEAA